MITTGLSLTHSAALERRDDWLAEAETNRRAAPTRAPRAGRGARRRLQMSWPSRRPAVQPCGC